MTRCHVVHHKLDADGNYDSRAHANIIYEQELMRLSFSW